MSNILLRWSLFILLIRTLQGNDVITNPSRNDGFGAQFQEIISAVIYAELNHKSFVYTPFNLIAHNYDNDQNFIQNKEWLINFIPHFRINYDGTLQTDASYKYFIDQNPDASSNASTLKKIKSIFRENKERNKYFNQDRLNIALHVRRPNPHDNRIEGTNTPDSVYLNLMHDLREKHKGQSPFFHIYSQGHVEPLQWIYGADDVILHIDESVEDTFTSMVFADILVISASSFSYAAALLSDGTVYYIPFWHSPLPGWIPFHQEVQ